MSNITNERIAKKRRLMALVMLAIVFAMCVAPATAHAISRRTPSNVGANSRIELFATRANANSRPRGDATAVTTNANSNGIRSKLIVRGTRPNGTNFALETAWRQVTGDSNRMLPRNTSVRSAVLESSSTNGMFTAEGQRRATGSTAWAVSGTLRVTAGW